MIADEQMIIAEISVLADIAARTISQRDQRIADAVAAGFSQREIGRAAGLSHTAIAKIVARITGDS